MKSAIDGANGAVGILVVTMAMVAHAETFNVNGSCCGVLTQGEERKV